MATEQDIALGVMIIAAGRANGVASYDLCRALIPTTVTLDADNLAPSTTRPGEPMWHQLVRNIKSHEGIEENFITLGLLAHVPDVGYEITNDGRRYLTQKGLHP